MSNTKYYNQLEDAPEKYIYSGSIITSSAADENEVTKTKLTPDLADSLTRGAVSSAKYTYDPAETAIPWKVLTKFKTNVKVYDKADEQQGYDFYPAKDATYVVTFYASSPLVDWYDGDTLRFTLNCVDTTMSTPYTSRSRTFDIYKWNSTDDIKFSWSWLVPIEMAPETPAHFEVLFYADSVLVSPPDRYFNVDSSISFTKVFDPVKYYEEDPAQS